MGTVVRVRAPSFSMSLVSEGCFLTWEGGHGAGMLGSPAQSSASCLFLGRVDEGALKPGRSLRGMGSRCLWGDNGLEEEGELGDMHMGLTGRPQVSRVSGLGCS